MKWREKFGNRLVLLIILCLLGPPPVRSQERIRTEKGEWYIYKKGEGRINIVGEVVDSQGHPLEGVDITVSERNNDGRDQIVARERTDKLGMYLFECLDGDQYHVRLSANSVPIADQEMEVDVRKEGLVLDWQGTQTNTQPVARLLDTCCRNTTRNDTQVQGDERSRRERVSLGGVVFDDHRHPVPGVEVYARDGQDTIVARYVTNDKGEYLLECLARGNYALTLDPGKTQYQGKTTVVHVGEGGVIVNWVVSTVTQATTTLRRGTCCAATPGRMGLGFPALVIGGGAGIGAAVAIDSPRRRPESPSQ